MKIKEKVVKRLLDELPRCEECNKVLKPKQDDRYFHFYCDECISDESWIEGRI